MYAPLVRSGGIVAFHDIITHTRESDCQVEKFWRKIKHHYRHCEFIEEVNEGALPVAVTGASMDTAGLGILYMP
jgi:hypothetical protein